MYDPVVADRNPVCVLPQVLNYCLRPLKGLFTVGAPFFPIADVKEFLKGIMILVFLGGTVEFKFLVCPKLFEFHQILTPEYSGNHADRLLVVVDDRVQLLRYCEYDMKVRCIQNIFFSGIDPFFLWEFLTHGTAPVPAGIMVNGNRAAFFTDTDIHSECSGLAVHDTVGSFSLYR